MKKASLDVRGWRRLLPLVAVLSGTGMSAAVQAGEIRVENPDWSLRWDNSIRYNLGVRAEKPDYRMLNSASDDEGDSLFGRGDVVTNRIDLLSEFDAVYRDRFGVRVSASGWYDNAYEDVRLRANPAFDTPFGNVSESFPGNTYTNFVKRYNRGPSGEILDAFVFGRFDIGSVPVTVRAGQHVVYWGESMFSFVHGVAHSQGPVDVRKMTVNPGTEVKEAFLPLTQVSVEAQLTSRVNLAAQYFLDWDYTRLPDGGTYLGGSDFLTYGGGTWLINPAQVDAMAAGLGLPQGVIAPVPLLGVRDKPDKRGDLGVRLTWRPEKLAGTLGFYYREYTDKLPQLVLGGLQPGLPLPTDLRIAFLEDNKLYGASYSREVGGISLGTELSYRKNGGLLMGGTTLVGEEPRGDTWHAVVNAVGLISSTPLFDSASYVAELTYSRLDKITENPQNFNGFGHVACATNNKWDGCATRDAWGLAVKFQPAWNQVRPGINLSLPIFVQYGIKGNSPVVAGGYQKSGTYSVGLGANIYNKYDVSLQYNGYLAQVNYGFNELGLPAVTSVNALSNTSDRGWISLTFKTTF